MPGDPVFRTYNRATLKQCRMGETLAHVAVEEYLANKADHCVRCRSFIVKRLIYLSENCLL